jgi:hypothetical protein
MSGSRQGGQTARGKGFEQPQGLTFLQEPHIVEDSNPSFFGGGINPLITMPMATPINSRITIWIGVTFILSTTVSYKI